MQRYVPDSLPEESIAHLTLPLEELWRLANGPTGWQPDDPDRRNASRFPLSRAALAQPLADNFEPQGKPLVALAYNVSCHGVALLVPERLDARYLRLRVGVVGQPAVVQAATAMYVEIGRCEPLGDVFEVAGRFISLVEN